MFVANIGGSAQQHERILAMSDESREGPDRRDFMVAAVGASAALAANSGAQGADQANTASRGTVYTGDMIDGKKVISALNIDDLEPGKKHLFYFQGVQMVAGQHWYVSVMVAKGARPGKRIALVSGVHGDEISRCARYRPSWTSLIRQQCQARYWPFWMYHARQLKAWRGDGRIQDEASILLT
jgi:hypothetical protein